MVNVRNVDMENYSIEATRIAKEVLEEDGPRLAERYSLAALLSSPTEENREAFEKVCISTVRRALFHYVKRRRIVTKTRMVYYAHLGLYRHRESEIDYSDVPSRYLDVKALVPEFPQMLDEIILEARKKSLIREIENTTSDAENASSEPSDQ